MTTPVNAKSSSVSDSLHSAGQETVAPAVNEVIHLARDLRREQDQTKAEKIALAFPDFSQGLRTSGRWLLTNDLLAMLISFIDGALLAWLVRSLNGGVNMGDFFNAATLQQAGIYFVIGSFGLLWLDSRGHYRQRLPYWEAVGDVISIAALGLVAVGFVEFAAHYDFSRMWIGLSWVLFMVLVLAGRSVTRHRLSRRGKWQIPAIIIGTGPTSQAAERALNNEKQMGFTIVHKVPPTALDELSRPHGWTQLLQSKKASHVFVALEGSEIEQHQAILKAVTRARVPCSIVPPWLGLPSSTLSQHHFMMQDVLLLHDTNRLKLPLPQLTKRLVDITLASLAILGLSPILLAVAIGVRLDGGPAMFIQKRVGRNGRLFNCLKFRSMRLNAEEALAVYLSENPEAAEEWHKFQKLKHDVRVTKFGELIRRTSMDELPQLFNVLKGDMSLVGPRPCMPGQESLYAEDFTMYTSVRPGITGPWQVSGRNTLTFKQRVNLEAWYARNWSLWMDIVIMLKTVPSLLKRGQTS